MVKEVEIPVERIVVKEVPVPVEKIVIKEVPVIVEQVARPEKLGFLGCDKSENGALRGLAPCDHNRKLSTLHDWKL